MNGVEQNQEWQDCSVLVQWANLRLINAWLEFDQIQSNMILSSPHTTLFKVNSESLHTNYLWSSAVLSFEKYKAAMTWW